MTERLHEATRLSETSGDGKWRVRYIQEGTSKNGVLYRGEVLSKYAKDAMPVGTRMLANHDPDAPYTGGDISKIAGKTISEPEYVAGDGVYGTVQLAKGKWRDFVDEFHDQIGLSVSIAAKTQTVGGVREALDLRADPYNSIDLVLAPSAGGKFSERLVESYKEISGIDLSDDGPTLVEPTMKKEENMEEKDFTRILESFVTPLVERIATLEKAVEGNVQTLSESVKAALPVPTEGATLAEAFAAGKLAHESGLPESVVARIQEGFVNGGDIKALVESEVKIRDEYLAEAKVAPVLGSFASNMPAATSTVPSAWAVPAKGNI